MAQEYGIFNLLPEGKTIEQIPPRLRWLYQGPFQTSHDKVLLEWRCEEINRERKYKLGTKDFRGDVTTLCEVRERTITYGEWKKSEEKG